MDCHRWLYKRCPSPPLLRPASWSHQASSSPSPPRQCKPRRRSYSQSQRSSIISKDQCYQFGEFKQWVSRLHQASGDAWVPVLPLAKHLKFKFKWHESLDKYILTIPKPHSQRSKLHWLNQNSQCQVRPSRGRSCTGTCTRLEKHLFKIPLLLKIFKMVTNHHHCHQSSWCWPSPPPPRRARASP